MKSSGVDVDHPASAAEGTRQKQCSSLSLSLMALDLAEPEIGFQRRRRQELCHNPLAVVDCRSML